MGPLLAATLINQPIQEALTHRYSTKRTLVSALCPNCAAAAPCDTSDLNQCECEGESCLVSHQPRTDGRELRLDERWYPPM